MTPPSVAVCIIRSTVEGISLCVYYNRRNLFVVYTDACDMWNWTAEDALGYMDSVLYLSAAILQLLCWCWIVVLTLGVVNGVRRNRA